MFFRKRKTVTSVTSNDSQAETGSLPEQPCIYTMEQFPLRLPLPLPPGVSRDNLFSWLKTTRVENAPDSIEAYYTQDFERFVHTYGLTQRIENRHDGRRLEGLELGANPYFTTMLLKNYTDVEWSFANYFGPSFKNGFASQRVYFNDPKNPESRLSEVIEFLHFNIEEDAFPFPSESRDIVLFCEIIEHLLHDPCRVLREIRRILRDDGTLILTTPNVNRLENVARMISGTNIYDPYSGYGPYGRHNREYNKHELYLLLTYLGFSIDEMFSADVHENMTNLYTDVAKFGHLIEYRQHDLGQYIFVRARKAGPDHRKKPEWLYRSYPENEIDTL